MIYSNRIEGIIVIIKYSNIEDVFKTIKTQDINFEDLCLFHPYIQSIKLQTNRLLDFINDELIKSLKQSQDNFAKGLIRHEQEKPYILETINKIIDSLLIHKQKLQTAPDYDKQ